MAYRPLEVPSAPQKTNSTSFMAKKGENKRDLPQLLDLDNSLEVVNYLITSDGGLKKREGLSNLFNVTGLDGIVMLEKYRNDVYIFGYGNTVAAYIKSTSTVVDIKTNFNATSQFNGVRWGEYFFIASPEDKVGRISQTLDYDNETSNFTVGSIVTGATSGATAVILELVDAGTTGTLTLGTINGTFQDDELITDSSGGSADVNGAIGFTYTEISNAPKAAVIKAFGSRLYTGNVEGAETKVVYSEVDDASNPPFDAWSDGINADEGGNMNFRNAGTVRDINILGDIIVVFSDEAKFAFRIDTIDSAGQLVKIETPIMYRNDFGGARGSISTNKGLFYVNERGLWQLTQVGQTDLPFTDQEVLTSVLLGNKFFDDINFDEADMLYDDKENNLFVTCSNASAANNFLFVYNTEFSAFTEITGWSINRFLDDNGTFYGCGSLKNTVWELFDGFDDDGTDIWTTFYQELQTGPMWWRKEMVAQYIQGFLSASTELTLRFDIYDRTGKFVADKLKLTWSAQTGSNLSDGFGIASWGTSPWGGDVDLSGLTENFDGFHGRIKNFQRIRLRITGHDKLPHAINWFSVETIAKVPIRRRKLTQI